MVERAAVPSEVVTALRTICLGLPEVHEEPAWVGTRWRVRSRTFAHVLVIDDGWPPVYAKVAGTGGPACVLTFRSAGTELAALEAAGPPFFSAHFGRDDVGMFLDAETDWSEVAELITESYCLLAPRRLAERVVRPET